MSRVFYEEHVPRDALSQEVITILGYGIQGRAQALNLRDSGAQVIIGNRDDAFRERALADGFPVERVAEAVRQGTIVLILLPDEVQPGELGEVLSATAREGITGMLASHASPACQAGIAHYWDIALGERNGISRRIADTIADIRSGKFARHLLNEQDRSYPDLRAWREGRSQTLIATETALPAKLRPPPQPLPRDEIKEEDGA